MQSGGGDMYAGLVRMSPDIINHQCKWGSEIEGLKPEGDRVSLVT